MIPSATKRLHGSVSNPAPVDVVSMLWAAAGLVMCVIDGTQSWLSTAGVLMLTQAVCVFVLYRRYRFVRDAVIPDFLTVFLLFQLIHKTVTLLSLLVTNNASLARNIGVTPLRTVDVAAIYQTQAEFLFLLATILFAVVWNLLERRRMLALWHEPAPRSVWRTYIFSCFAYFLLPEIAGLGQITELMRLFSIGALGILLGGHSRYAFGKPHSTLVYLAGIPLLLNAFSSGMKGVVMLVLLPVLLPLMRRLTMRRLGVVAVMLLFVLLVVFPFAQVWRQANWNPRIAPSQKIGVVKAADRVIDGWSQNGVIETSATSAAQWLHRGSSAQTGGLVMQIAAHDGYVGPVLIQGLATIWIPRFLWPDKPSYAPGAWFTWYLGFADSPESATTSTAMRLPTELYWSFGPFGVLIGMVVVAVVYFYSWLHLLKGAKASTIPMVALFALLVQATMLEGLFAIYAVSGPLILLVYVKALQLAAQAVTTLRKR